MIRILDFSSALLMLKDGHKLARNSWYDSGIWIEAQFPDNNSEMTKPYLVMCKGKDKFPCDLSCESIFANDWVIVG